MILRSTPVSIKLEAVLAGAVSANQPEYHVEYIDYNNENQPTIPQPPSRGALNSTTDVEILAAPVNNPAREIQRISLYNKDTASVTFIVKTDDGTTERILIRKTIGTLDSLCWEKGLGWYTTATGSGIFTTLTVTGASTLTGAVSMGSTLSVTGTLTGAAANFSGNVTLGDAVGDSHTINGPFTQNATSGANAISVVGSGGGDSLRLFVSAAGGGANVLGRNNADSAYALLNLYGSAVTTNPGGSEVTRVTSTGLGVFCTPSYELELNKSESGGDVIYWQMNASNTASSNAKAWVNVAGSSAGDPVFLLGISGVLNWYIGADNSASDKLCVGLGVAPGASDFLTIDTSGNVVVPGTPGGGAISNSFSSHASGASAGGFNRTSSDGDVIIICQDGTQEGSISVSGTTVSYNAFLGSHWGQLEDGSKPVILRGTVIESIDQMCEWPGEENEKLPKVKVSDTAASPSVYGVFLDWDNDDTRSNDLYVAAVGSAVIRVRGTVQRGDLLESAGDGTARVQSDQFVKSSTIAKVIAAIPQDQYDDGSYTVPCIFFNG